METTVTVDALLEQVRPALARGEGEAVRQLLAGVRPQAILALRNRLEPEEARLLVSYLPAEPAAELVPTLPESGQVELVGGRRRAALRDLLEEMDPDDLADSLQLLQEHDRDRARALKRLLDPETLAVAEVLSGYEEDVAGGLMTPEYIGVPENLSVAGVLELLREEAPDAETIYYLYVVDGHQRLTGVLSLRELIRAGPELPVRDVMHTDVVWVAADTDQEEVARIMADYDFSVLPVVDQADRLVGIVTVDDVLDVVEEEATEDIHRLASAPVDLDYARAGPMLLFRKRVPWLVLLVVSMTLTFNVISHYEEVIAEVVILAAFIPLLIGTGGNVGAQVATMVVRSLATRELEPSDYARVFVKESATGLLLGLAFGLFIGLYVLLFRAEPRVALALGMTMVLIALVANLVGASLPFLFRRMGIDPALTSSPGITTVMDVVGLLIYFRIVLWVLDPVLG